MLVAAILVVARGFDWHQTGFTALPWVVLPLAAAAGFYGVGGLYEARRSRRADPTWYASAGLIAALSAVSANIIVGGA